VDKLQESVERGERRMEELTQTVEEQQKKLDSLTSQLSTLTNQLTTFFTATKSNTSNTTAGPGGVARLEIVATGGVTYVRWGRTNCAGDATTLYSGYAATSRWNETGGGANILCVHGTPETSVKTSSYGTRLFGIEYDFSASPFSTDNFSGTSFYYNDMPCTVCHVQRRSHQLMIPARNTCPAGWTKEFNGFIVSSWYKNNKSSFYCVDATPEVITGGSTRLDTAYAHPVDVQCGPLPCPGFAQGNRLACVVCSK